jgi:tRNA (guanine26-N2/guanine27-N2)-dimethyltransferase
MATVKFVETIEGMTRLLVPAGSLSEKPPPRSPAFFNPSAKVNRDMSVLAYKAFLQDMKINKKTFADALGGIGARALRVAVELPEIDEVYINDTNILAIEAARNAAKLNFVTAKCNFSVNDVCKFLIEHPTKDGKRFALVDLDPFGSPSPYIDCVLRSVLDGGLISVTATDTTVLCGVYPDVCFRKYFGRPLRNHYANETAIRLVTSLVALTASRLNLAALPIFVHANLHYIRVYVNISVSSSKANKIYDNIGYIRHCFRCGNRNTTKEYNGSEFCELCKNRFSIGGQLWIGRLFNKDFIKKMSNNELNSKAINNNEKNRDDAKKILPSCLDEIDDIPHYFLADEIASKLKMSPYPLQKIIEKLLKAGYRASKSSLRAGAFKTDARIDQILKLLR